MVDFTKPVTTKSGRPVKIFTTEGRNKNYPIVGEIFIDGRWDNCTWTVEGVYSTHTTSNHDLINPPEEIEYWVNMYPLDEASARALMVHKDRDGAVSDRTSGCIATIPIKFKKGEGL